MSSNKKIQSTNPFQFYTLLFGLLLAGSGQVSAASLPADVLSQLNSYNEVWPSPSTNGSPGSMPIGNGDITANVWVENGGDLMMYIGKSDSWSEGTRLLKIGRTRIHFAPNPFSVGAPFNQTLDFYHGEIDIAAGQPDSQVNLRVWIDANQPVIRVEATGGQSFTMTCSNEVWRNVPYTATNSADPPSGGWRGVNNGWTESADVAVSLPDRLVSYHRNATSLYQTILTGENLNGLWTSFPDPYINRTFGATIKGTNFSSVDNYTLQSAAGTNFMVSIYAYTAQTSAATDWQNQMSNLVAQVDATDIETARTNHFNWWDAFWNRSWIFVSGDINATNVTRGYLEQRFMEACQGRGNYPIKFNGGTFTFDYNGQNGDYRRWGPGYWNQNTRHLYWPLLAAGDFDLMQPWFNCYTNLLGLQTAVTSKYYGHGGAFFPETYNFFGLYLLTDWGSDNTATSPSNTYIKYHYQGALETLAMMLDYYSYTQDSAFATNYVVPFGTQVIRFFDQHWSKVNGKLFFYPANACEMYWSCTNSTDYISGLMSDIPRLVALPANFTSPALINEWTNCYAALPPLPTNASGTYVLPAQTYGAAHNAENPECYCIFPYHIYGIGKPNFNIGLATFNNRVVQNNKNCWSQDVEEEPLVGLTGSAQADVISNFSQKDSQCRFQAFWTSHNDYLPDLDNGGAAMTGLQFMLMQCNGSEIRPLPAWPTAWNVDYKLCAASNTTVRLVLQGGTVSQLAVTPSSRTNDLVEPPPAAPGGLIANGANTQVALIWTGSTGAGSYNIKRATVSGGTYTTIATGVTSLSYIDTGLLNGTNYYYVVSASGIWGESSNSTEAAVVPSFNFAVHFEGDLIVNLQSPDLNSNTRVWTNRTSNSQSVGNFTTLGGGSLDVAAVSWNGQAVKTLFVNSVGNNSVQSALVSPAEINSNSPVSVEAWINAVNVSPKRAIVNYGYQGGSSAQVEDREFSYDTGGSGVISGDFGNLDTAWTTAPDTNVWHYLAYTWDGSNITAYLDGVQDVRRNVGAICKTVQTFMQVGSGIGGTGVNGGNDVAFDYIACARVESGVLTPADIVANYAMGPLGTAAATTPAGLTAVAGDGRVTLSWNASSNATDYNVKRSLVSNGTYTVIVSNLATLAFTNTNLINGTTYYFVVSATNPAGESVNSVPAGAQPVSTTSPQLNFSVNGAQIQFMWLQDHTGWTLQMQTNSLRNGLGTNWMPVPASMITNQITFPIDPAGGSAFFRLVYP
jgi:fibronectin type 3 domain-containing protein